MSLPSNTTVPPVRSCSRSRQRPKRRLAAARLAHQPERLARQQSRLTSSTACTRATSRCSTPPRDREVLGPRGRARSGRRRAGSLTPTPPGSGHRHGALGRAPRRPAGGSGRGALGDRGRRARAARRSGRTRVAQRGRKRQPGGGSSSEGGAPGIAVSRRGLARSSRGIDPSSPQVYGCCGVAEQLARPCPYSTTRPAYITATRSAISATTPRSWVISTTAEPNSLRRSLDQLQDLGLDGHVERGRRLVGDQQVGVARERHRDHHALAHAARELVRVVVHAPPPALGMPTARSSSTARVRAASLPTASRGPGSAPRSASRPCRPGSARSSDPGRSSRSRGRAPRASRRRAAVIRSRPL